METPAKRPAATITITDNEGGEIQYDLSTIAQHEVADVLEDIEHAIKKIRIQRQRAEADYEGQVYRDYSDSTGGTYWSNI